MYTIDAVWRKENSWGGQENSEIKIARGSLSPSSQDHGELDDINFRGADLGLGCYVQNPAVKQCRIVKKCHDLLLECYSLTSYPSYMHKDMDLTLILSKEEC